MHPESVAYNVPRAFRIRGDLNLEALKRALDAIVRRHAILRTTYVSRGETPVQIVGPLADVSMRQQDLRSLPEGGREPEVRRIQLLEARQPFNLERDLLLRAQLLRLEDRHHVLLLTTHHIASDGISKAIFLRELAAFYEAFAAGKQAFLPELPIQYSDYSVWERQHEPASAEHLEFWKRQLDGLPDLLALPTDRPRPAVQSLHGERQHFHFSRELLLALTELGRTQGATLFMTLTAGFKVLLHRYAGQDDIFIGTPVANRQRAEISNLIGYFSNAVVLRTDLAGDPTFREALQRVRRTALDAYEHQDVPFDRLVREMRTERNLSHTPLFQVMFSMNVPVPPLTIPELQIESLLVERGEEKFDLLVGMAEGPNGLDASFEYNTDLFDPASIERMARCFETLLRGIAADPDTRLSRLPLLPHSEQEQMLIGWNQTHVEYPSDSCVHQLFEAQAQCTPQAIAAEHETERLTYRELDQRSNQLARRLQRLGIKPGTVVGILMGRGLTLAASLLGVLKAGAACLTLDPKYPPERLRLMLEDSQAPVLLVEGGGGADFVPAGVRQMPLALGCIDLESESSDPLPAAARAEDIAYVIYTSGSTGRPKGVLLTHRGLVNHHVAATALYGLSSKDRVLQFSSISFDIAVEEIFPTWASGGTVVFPTDEMPLEVAGFLRWVGEQGVSVLDLPTAYWHELVRELRGHPQPLPRSLRLVIVGGEKASAAALAGWQKAAGPQVRWINTYGPTETSVIATAFEPPQGWPAERELPIGRPIANTRIYVLDQYMNLAPEGVPGEMYIGGPGVGRGYLNRPDLTEQKFVSDPYGAPGERLYKTGDVVRYCPDGNLEFVGRIDQQVKIRGFRVELGEIEEALRQHSAVRDAVVVAYEDHGEKRLVAYVAAPNGCERELREHLRRRMPDYMLPAAIILLNTIPLTPNGKVDRAALPKPECARAGNGEEYVAPRNAMEEVVAGIWAEVLKVVRVGVNDNVFELGAHSLLAMQALARLRRSLSVELPLRSLFETPTVAGLARRILATQSGTSVPLPPLVALGREQPLPLSFPQQRLWFMSQLEPGSPFYNIPWTLRIRGPLNSAILESSLSEVVRRHEALRTRFITVNDEPAQMVASPEPLRVETVDISGDPECNAEDHARMLAAQEAQQPFDLASDVLLRAKLIRLKQDDHVLVLTMHHIASDAWSVGVLSRELWTMYATFTQGKMPSLPELRIQYPDYAVWQRQRLSGNTLDGLLTYWKKRLENVSPVLNLPFDEPRPAQQDFAGAKFVSLLPDNLVSALCELSRKEGATLFNTLLVTYQVWLSRQIGKEQFLLGTDVANRLHLESENLIGFFINLLPVHCDVSGNPRFRDLLRRMHQSLADDYAHQEIPFEKLVEELRLQRSSSYNPLVQALFVHHNVPKPNWRIAELAITPFGSVTTHSRFDLAVFVIENAEGLQLHWVYKTGLWRESSIRRFASQYERLLANAVSQPDARISMLEHLTDEEREALQSLAQERKNSKMKKFMDVRVKPVTITQAEGISAAAQEERR
jgi:amino acid adenylation domain-containing protein